MVEKHADPAVPARASELDADELQVRSDALLAGDADRTAPVAIVARRRVGETELDVFPIALGAARLAALDDAVAFAILDRFAARGGTLIDLASHGGRGRSEALVGEWLERRRLTDRMQLSIRMSPTAGVLERDAAPSAQSLIAAVARAIARLRVDSVDLVIVDLRTPGITHEHGLAAIDSLATAGRARYAAVAGATADELLSARVLAAANGLPRFVGVLGDWDPLQRSAFDGEVGMAIAAQNLAILPDASLAASLLSAPPLPQKEFASRILGLGLPTRAPGERAVDLLGRGRQHRVAAVLDRAAAEHRVRPIAVALAWLLAKRGVAAPIVGVTRPEQIDAIMTAAAVRLTRSDILDLDRAVEG